MAKLGKTLMSLFLDKRAREAIEAQGKTRAKTPATPPTPAPAAPPPTPEPHPSREELNARLEQAADASAKRAASPGRQQLIQQALKVRAAKAKMLDELPQEQRLKLQAMAQMSFLKAKSGGKD